MDTEPPSDFKSIFAKFEVDNCSKKPPISPPPPNISNVRSNPTFLGVINSLENKPKTTPPPIAEKPTLPAKPNRAALTSGNKPPVPEKPAPGPKDMRLNKRLRHTLHVADPPRLDGNGMCSQSPQVYRHSWSASSEESHPGPATSQSDSQACYEVIDDSFKTTEKPKIPLKSPLKYQTPNILKQKPSQPLGTNQLDAQDFYEVVDDSIKTQGKPSPPFLADLKNVLAVTGQKSSPVMESSQYETQDCYEVVHDPPTTPLKPPSSFATQSFFSEPKTPDGSEMSQECYEEVDSTFHQSAERLPPIGGNPNQVSIPDPPSVAEITELDGQENYEEVNGLLNLQLEPPPPFNDPPKSQNNSPSMKANPKPPSLTTTLSNRSPNKGNKPPSPPDAKTKPKTNFSVNKTPRKKILQSIKLLGPAPPKQPRPPQVDLTSYTSALPCKVVPRPPKESSETEYEVSAPSRSSHEEDCYDDTMTLATLQEGDPNVYEVEETPPEKPKIRAPKPYVPSPSPEEGCECYDDVLKLRGSTADCNVYEVEESGSQHASEPARPSLEVAEENKDFRVPSIQEGLLPSFTPADDYYSIVNLDANRSTLPKNDAKDGKISKSEQTFRKKFKVTGLEDTLYTTTIVQDFKPEKYMLAVKKGDTVDVIRITDCPPGKWLAKDHQENYGFVPVSCVDISQDILSFGNQHLLTVSASSDIYTDVERTTYDSGIGTDLSIASDSYSGQSDDTYDDVDNKSATLSSSAGKSKGFVVNIFKKSKKEESGSPAVSVTSDGTADGDGDYASVGDVNAREKEDKSSSWRSFFHKVRDVKGRTESPKNEGKANGPVSLKKLNKEEKIFREKFKYSGDIKVFTAATINDSAPLSPRDKMDLSVKPGETVDVIDVTNEDQIICRNSEGKFGYVPIEILNFQSNY